VLKKKQAASLIRRPQHGGERSRTRRTGRGQRGPKPPYTGRILTWRTGSHSANTWRLFQLGKTSVRKRTTEATYNTYVYLNHIVPRNYLCGHKVTTSCVRSLLKTTTYDGLLRTNHNFDCTHMILRLTNKPQELGTNRDAGNVREHCKSLKSAFYLTKNSRVFGKKT